MKHLSAMLLAMLLPLASAIGQNVTVIMKDGSSHKFNADYISEITFQDSSAEPGNVVFNSVTVEPYSGGNVTLTFTTKDGDVTCVTDLYGRPDAKWLEAGVYTVASSNAPYTMDPGYSGVTVAGESKSITGGTVDVTLQGHVYSFAIDLTLSDGSAFKGSFSGELDTYTQWMTAVMNKASFNVNPQPAGDFYVKFNDEAWKYDIAIVFTADADATELPAGEYAYSDMRAPGTISPACYVDTYSPNSNNRLVSGSKVTVEKNDAEYTISMALLLEDGRTADFTFKGEISGTPSFETPQTETLAFDIIDVNPYSGGNTGLTFNMSADRTVALSLDCYGSATATYFETGDYIVGSDGSLYIDTNANYTFLAEDGKTTALKSGKMTVSRNEGVYTFDMSFTLADGREIKASYTGELNKFTPVTNYTVTKAAYNENARPAGNFYIKFNDDNWNCAVGLDIFADASATVLPAGTYTFAETGEPGTFGSKTYVETSTTYYAKEGSTVEVKEDNGVYSIVISIVKEDGNKAIVSFDGEITGNPVFE